MKNELNGELFMKLSDFQDISHMRYRKLTDRHMSSGLSLFFILQPIHIVIFAFLLEPMRPEVLFLSGFVTLIVYSSLLYHEYFRDRSGVTPFLFYLFLSWIRIGVIPLYLTAVEIYGYHNDLIFAGIHDVSSYYSHGLFIEVLGDWFFVSGYYYFRKHSRPASLLQSNPVSENYFVMRNGALFLFAMTYSLRLMEYFGFSLEWIGQPYKYVRGFGSASAMMMLLFAIRRAPSFARLFMILLLGFIVIIELGLALGSYMKTDAIILAIPFFILFINHAQYRRKRLSDLFLLKKTMALFIITLFSISVLFNYSQLRRKDFSITYTGASTDGSPEIAPYLLKAIKASLPWTQEFKEVQIFPKSGVWYFFSRNDMISADAWCYSYVDSHGTNNAKYLLEVPAVIIPRFLWPQKPFVVPGRDMSVLMGQAKYSESATTSTGLSMAGALYLAWGYSCVIVGMFINGILLRYFWNEFSPGLNVNPISTMICISFYLYGIRWFEGVFDGNATMYILLFIFFLPASRIYEKMYLVKYMKINNCLLRIGVD